MGKFTLIRRVPVCSEGCIFLGRLSVLGVDQKLMFLFYQAVLESIIRFGMSARCSNISVHSKCKLNRLLRTALKVMGRTESSSLQSLCEESVLKPAQRVSPDPAVILHSEYELLLSGRRYICSDLHQDIK